MEANITSYNKRISFFEKLGFRTKICNELSSIVSYGTSDLGYSVGKYYNIRFIISSNKVRVFSGIEIPESFKIHYLRILTGFSYSIFIRD